jgi:signal transduction histidine kinase/CheY-like chemotaxis protein
VHAVIESTVLTGLKYFRKETDGVESIIYKVEELTRLGGEDVKLVALVDVSVLEKSRKQEVAANTAKSEFLASMSHEIRTPMNGILGMVASLLDAKLPPSEDEKLKIIKKSSGLLMTIINDILDFSKIEAGKMLLEEIPFNLRDEISLVVDLYKPLAKQNKLKLDIEIMASVPDNLIGDPFRLRQVISNLVSNALKFTEEGRVVVGAELMEHYKSRLQLLFWVEDTGIGIPEDKLSEIFGNYAQSSDSHSRKFGGSGLGTSIAKQLVELMNGEIWVESPSRITQSDKYPGSRFSFTIEVFSNEKIEKNYNYESIRQMKQITALFLTKDPNPEMNKVGKVLHNFGLNVVTKIYQNSTIDTVIHHINVKKDQYQLVIISDRPGYSGFDLAKRMKDEGLMPDFPVIMICGNDQPGNFRITRTFDIDFYLIEPFENKELLDILQDTFVGLEEQKHLSPMLQSLPEELDILLVDDNPINQKVAQAIFKSIAYEIDIASNGLEALDKVKEKDYDIIFMDLFMPEMDGFDTTIQLRKNGFEKPIIAMSANIEDERKADARKAGMNEYLSKPVKTETIKELLIKLFSSSVDA